MHVQRRELHSPSGAWRLVCMQVLPSHCLWPSLSWNLVYWLLLQYLTVGSCPAMTAAASCQGLNHASASQH